MKQLTPDSPDVVGPPQFCAQTLNYWEWYRTEACEFGQGVVTVTDTSTGALVGELFYNLIGFTYTEYNTSDWAHQIQIEEDSNSWGLVNGSTVEGAATCTGNCTTISNSFPPQTTAPSTVDAGQAIFVSTMVGVGQKGYAYTTFYWYFTNPQWAGPSTITNDEFSPIARCDNVLTGYPAGCAFYSNTPTMVYALAGPYPTLARHIQAAQQSGLPGAPGTNPLYRTQDTNLINANRNTACPTSLPRPTGFSCDEYPFATTYEGAFIETSDYDAGPRTWPWCQVTLGAPNSTGPFGYSVCMINASDNSNGGNALGLFYYYNRVIDDDTFYVSIT